MSFITKFFLLLCIIQVLGDICEPLSQEECSSGVSHDNGAPCVWDAHDGKCSKDDDFEGDGETEEEEELECEDFIDTATCGANAGCTWQCDEEEPTDCECNESEESEGAEGEEAEELECDANDQATCEGSGCVWECEEADDCECEEPEETEETTEGGSTSNEAESTNEDIGDSDGCEQYDETNCNGSMDTDDNVPCFWDAHDNKCNKQDGSEEEEIELQKPLSICENFQTQVSCEGTTGQALGCSWDSAESACQDPSDPEEEGDASCENFDEAGADACNAGTGEGGVTCQWLEDEQSCKELTCEDIYEQTACESAVVEEGGSCSWDASDSTCNESEVEEIEEPEIGCEDFTDETTCGTGSEDGRSCLWLSTEGKCEPSECKLLTDETACSSGQSQEGGECYWTSEGCSDEPEEVEEPEDVEETEDNCDNFTNEPQCTTFGCSWNSDTNLCGTLTGDVELQKPHTGAEVEEAEEEEIEEVEIEGGEEEEAEGEEEEEEATPVLQSPFPTPSDRQNSWYLGAAVLAGIFGFMAFVVKYASEKQTDFHIPLDPRGTFEALV